MLEQMDKQENKSDQSTSQSGAWRENLFKENSKGDANPAATHVYPDATLPHITLLDHNAASKDLLNTRTETSPASPEANKSGVPGKSYLQAGIDAGTSMVIADDKTRNTVNQLAAEFVKTASLFTGGKLGLAGSFITYGLDQARPADSWKEQTADFMLGGAKGTTMKGMFSVIGASGEIAPIKGALLGMSSGAIDEVFKRQTFIDPSSLNDRLRQHAFNPQAVLMNAAVFTAGEGLYSGINFATKGALSENRLISGMVMGGSFGFVNGTTGEAFHQLKETGSINTSQVLLRGLLEGSVAAAGAGVGLKVSEPAFQQQVKDGVLSLFESKAKTQTPKIDLSGVKSQIFERRSAANPGCPDEPDPENPRRPKDPGGPYNEPGSDTGPDSGGQRYPNEPGGPYNEPGSDGGPFMGIMAKGAKAAMSSLSRSDKTATGYPDEPDPENPRRPNDPGGPYNEPGSDTGPDSGGQRYPNEPGGPYNEPGSDGGPFMGIMSRIGKK